MRQVITNVEQPYEYEETYKTNRRKNIRRPNMRRAVTTVNNSLQRHSHSLHCFLKEKGTICFIFLLHPKTNLIFQRYYTYSV